MPSNEKSNSNRKERVHIGGLELHLRDLILQFLEQFGEMWDGKLGTARETKHRIELLEGAKSIYWQTYPSGPTAREAEKSEVERKLREGIIEP